MIVTEDERLAPRFDLLLPVELETASAVGGPIAARSINLGAGGLCVEPGVGLADKTPVLCRLATDRGSLEAHGQVAWQLDEDGAYRVGIRFSALSPAMALWLASAARNTSVAVTPPASDTQPILVPAADGYVQPERPVPQSQLSLWSGRGPAPDVEIAVEVAEDPVTETEVLYDDMPSPQTRMMRPSPKKAVTQPAEPRDEVQAFSAKHRLAALTHTAKGTSLRLWQMVAAKAVFFRGIATKARRFGAIKQLMLTLSARAPWLTVRLRKRPVQLALAAAAVLLLVGSGLAVLASGSEDPEAEIAQAAPSPVDSARSYWEPPVMPAPVPADQEIVEPTRSPEPAVPTVPDLRAEASLPSEMPLASAEAVELPPLPAEEPVDEAPAVARELPSEPPRRAAAAVPATTPDRRVEAARPRRAERQGQASPEPAERRQQTAERSRPVAAEASAARTTSFRLNLSGAPGPIQSYPLANPNGIVIDVPELRHPGDATKLTSDNPRIRFVKIINRESGVRFIVYVNGSLPEYEIEPAGRGLRVAFAN